MSTLTELAEQLLEDAKRFDAYTAFRQFPPYSLNKDTMGDLTYEGEEIKKRVVDGAQKIKQMGLGPVDSVWDLAWSAVDLLALHSVYHYRIAQNLPLSQDALPTTFDDLHACLPDPKPPLERLRRLLKMALANQIFDQPTPDTIVHNDVSRALVTVPGWSDWLGMFFDDMLPAFNHTIEATDKLSGEDLEEPDKSGFQLAHGTLDDISAFMAKDPVRGSRYGNALTFLASFKGFNVRFLVHGYDEWVDLDSRSKENVAKGGEKIKIVDMGGGYGPVSIALAKTYSNLEFVVQDLPEVIERAKAELSSTNDFVNEQIELQNDENEDRYEERVTFMAHDMFKEQVVQSADVYFMKWIFSNWSDKHCIDILKNLVPALKPGKSKVLVFDYVLPEIVGDSYTEKVYTRGADILMMAAFNGRERTEKEYRSLFEAADAEFRFQGAVQPRGSGMWVVEATFEAEQLE